ncbi:hypothetical protein RSSM_02930 [Rhodopirellula sallentina SM41]|uniref:Uncharacterized protein n=1 Tax=Rhodopirellula sallentina SM41 TaxID=1263870 RepID=M5U2I1_9BACT|nr:hypothetical protein RSSM_02930 [Rhodopirellula sallentina SM41]
MSYVCVEGFLSPLRWRGDIRITPFSLANLDETKTDDRIDDRYP